MRRSQFVIERAAEQSSDSSILRRRLARFCLANHFVHNLPLLVRADGIQSSVEVSSVLFDEIPAPVSDLFFINRRNWRPLWYFGATESFCAGSNP